LLKKYAMTNKKKRNSSVEILGKQPAAAPRMLEIETAGNTIHIQNFSGKIQTRYQLAFHCFYLYFRKLYTAAGYKFFFIGGLSGYIKSMAQQKFGKLIVLPCFQFAPAGFLV